MVMGFGRRPLGGRSCVVRGRRSKASQGGNRGQEGAPVWSGATYGDFRIADGSLAGLPLTATAFEVRHGLRLRRMAENAGALWAPWHPMHVASANCFPAAGLP